MKQLLLLLAITGSLAASSQAPSTAFDTFPQRATDTGWKKVKHPYGYSITLPPGFKQGYLKADSKIQYYYARQYPLMDADAMSVAVEDGGNLLSLKKSHNDFMTLFKGAQSLFLNDTSFSVIVKGKELYQFYYYFIKKKKTYSLRISYPIEYKKDFEYLITQIALSFK